MPLRGPGRCEISKRLPAEPSRDSRSSSSPPAAGQSRPWWLTRQQKAADTTEGLLHQVPMECKRSKAKVSPGQPPDDRRHPRHPVLPRAAGSPNSGPGSGTSHTGLETPAVPGLSGQRRSPPQLRAYNRAAAISTMKTTLSMAQPQTKSRTKEANAAGCTIPTPLNAPRIEERHEK